MKEINIFVYDFIPPEEIQRSHPSTVLSNYLIATTYEMLEILDEAKTEGRLAILSMDNNFLGHYWDSLKVHQKVCTIFNAFSAIALQQDVNIIVVAANEEITTWLLYYFRKGFCALLDTTFGVESSVIVHNRKLPESEREALVLVIRTKYNFVYLRRLYEGDPLNSIMLN